MRLRCNKFETGSPTTNKFYSTKVSLPFSSPRVLLTKRIGPHNHEVLSILIGSFRSLHLKNQVNKCTALVVWALRTNLGSAIGSGRFTKQDSENIKLPLYHRSVIVGLLLSDGGLSFSNKTAVNALLRFSQSFAQYKYFWFVFFILSPFCSKYPYSRTQVRKGSVNYSMELYTRTLPCFTELYHIFYINGKKVIPENIYHLLTPVSLAHLIMGDGGAQSSGIRIGTDSFSVKECVLLINVLIIKFGIDCSIHMQKGKPRIYIPASSKKAFIQLVKPHMISSMYYKLGEPTSSGEQSDLEGRSSKLLPSNYLLPVTKISYISSILPGGDMFCAASSLHQDTLSIIFGSLLGRGRMVKEKEGSRMVFCQLDDQREYLIWVRNKLAELGYCRYTARIKRTKVSGKANYLCFETSTSTSFNFIQEAFYPKDRKVVPDNIGNYLTPLALAVWLMNDGSLYKKKGIKFTANSFRLKEVKLLSNVLSEKYNLKTSIVERGVVNEYNIYIPKSSLEILRNIVKPYLHESMIYKISL